MLFVHCIMAGGLIHAAHEVDDVRREGKRWMAAIIISLMSPITSYICVYDPKYRWFFVFYVIEFVENVAMLVLTLLFPSFSFPFTLFVSIASVIAFLIGILFNYFVLPLVARFVIAAPIKN